MSTTLHPDTVFDLLADQSRSLSGILRELKLSIAQFARWIEEPTTQQHLADFQKVFNFRAQLNVIASAPAAARTLTLQARGQSHTGQFISPAAARTAANSLLKLATVKLPPAPRPPQILNLPSPLPTPNTPSSASIPAPTYTPPPTPRPHPSTTLLNPNFPELNTSHLDPLEPLSPNLASHSTPPHLSQSKIPNPKSKINTLLTTAGGHSPKRVA
jgi:hypothetical protein